jgi:hypothetical protein
MSVPCEGSEWLQPTSKWQPVSSAGRVQTLNFTQQSLSFTALLSQTLGLF